MSKRFGGPLRFSHFRSTTPGVQRSGHNRQPPRRLHRSHPAVYRDV